MADELRHVTTNGGDSLRFELIEAHLQHLLLAGVEASHSVYGHTTHVHGMLFEDDFAL